MVAQIDSLAAASELFRESTLIQYQNKQVLQNTIVEQHGTSGTTLNIPIMQPIEMQEISFAPTNIPITRTIYTNAQVFQGNFALKTVLGDGERTLFAFDRIVAEAKNHALAAARFDDFVKIQALFQYVAANPGEISVVPVTEGVNTGINSGKMALALSLLEDGGVDITDFQCSMWLPALIKTAMVNDDRVVNFFYNAVKPLVDYKIKAYLDTDIRVLGSAGVNKIPRTGSGTTMAPYVYNVPLVHQESMAQAYNRDIKSRMIWHDAEDRYEFITTFTTGAQVIKPEGIVLMTANTPFVQNS